MDAWFFNLFVNSQNVEKDLTLVKKIRILTKETFNMFMRDRQTTLMMFFSPIAFTLILGFVIAGISGGTQSVEVKVAIHMSSEFQMYKKDLESKAKKSGFVFTFVKNDDELKKLVSSAKAQMGISMSSTSLNFFYNQSFGQYNNYLRILQDFISQAVRKKISGVPTYIQVDPIPIKRNANLTVISFVVPGAIAIAILTACVLSTVTTFSNYRSNNVLKRIRVTPLNGNLFAFSIAIHRFWSSLLSSYLTLVTSELVFSTHYSVNWLLFTLMMSSAVILSIGLGTIFSIVFRDMWTTLSFSTIILTVMMLFSNVFYPFSIMPNYMRIIAHLMPITYFMKGLRYALGISPMYGWEFIMINVVFAVIGTLMIIVGGRSMFYLERR